MDAHERWTDRLSDYLDDGLSASEREAVDRHLSGCVECRVVLRDLETLRAAAGSLGPVEPARDLWPDVEARIRRADPAGEDAGVIQLRTAGAPARRKGLWLSVPQLVAASVALIVATAVLARAIQPTPPDGPGPVPASDPSAVRAVSADVAPVPASVADDLAALESALAVARDRLDPNTVRILEKNLLVIERAIDDSRRALALDPENAFLQDHLDRAYERKLTYLREAAEIAEWSS